MLGMVLQVILNDKCYIYRLQPVTGGEEEGGENHE